MADRSLIEDLRRQICTIESGCGDAREAGMVKVPKGDAAASLFGGNALNLDASGTSESESAFKKIIALVNMSDRSEHTIRERLEQAEFSQNAIDAAVSRAKEYGFIDDARFASVLIRSRIAQRRGISGVERELRRQGIDIEAVPGWPQDFEIDEEAEVSRALEVLEKKPPKSKNKRDGAYRKLMQRGYSSSIAATAARIWSDRQVGLS